MRARDQRHSKLLFPAKGKIHRLLGIYQETSFPRFGAELTSGKDTSYPLKPQCTVANPKSLNEWKGGFFKRSIETRSLDAAGIGFDSADKFVLAI